MEKITSQDQFCIMKYGAQALDNLGLWGSTPENFWMAREEARMLAGEYTAISIVGDSRDRFLHGSTDKPDMVAYTKDAENGRADIQTRTTLAAYCAKFGLQEPVDQTDSQDAPATAQTSDSVQNTIKHCLQQLEHLKASISTLLG